MGSFDAVNYSLRPSKSIQRNLVFDDVRTLKDSTGLSDFLYVGFGSVWFVDFVMAHKVLGASKLISVEGNDVGYARAKFNRPYSCVDVEHGYSNIVLPKLYADGTLHDRPWMMWLDYDYEFNESVKEDIRLALGKLPPNSVFIVTFNAMAHRYAQKVSDRAESLRGLLGDVIPDVIPRSSLEKEDFAQLIKTGVLEFMKSVVGDSARLGGFVPAFDIAYRDQSWMVTVGGVLPALDNRDRIRGLVSSGAWRSCPAEPVVAPHLTAKEAAMLQAELPGKALDRPAVKALGFDLEEDQIRAFCNYYLYYPNFAQVVA